MMVRLSYWFIHDCWSKNKNDGYMEIPKLVKPDSLPASLDGMDKMPIYRGCCMVQRSDSGVQRSDIRNRCNTLYVYLIVTMMSYGRIWHQDYFFYGIKCRSQSNCPFAPHSNCRSQSNCPSFVQHYTPTTVTVQTWTCGVAGPPIR